MTEAKTVLIGLDGATFSILDPFMARGVMPFLREFLERGVRAPLRSVVPALTPPGWTSLMTGKRPGQHGVFDFFQKESPESQYFRIADSHDVHSDTIWSIASEQGQRVTALNFPITYPAPIVNGCVVPGGWMPWRQLRLGCHPPGLFDRLKALPSFNARELALDMALEEKAIEGCAAEEYADWITLHTRREQRWFELLRYLMREESANLTGIVFDGVDKLHHLCWRFMDPACQSPKPSDWELEITRLCERYFRQLDEIIAEIVALAGPEATVIMASDHGGGRTSEIFYLNAWLEREGYLSWTDGNSAPPDSVPQLGFRSLARHVYELDWKRTVAYAATPSSQGVHIVRRSPDGSKTMSDGEYRRLQAELKDGLLGAKDPTNRRPIVTDVRLREDEFPGPYETLAPDLTIDLADGAVVSILQADVPVKRRPEVLGSHRAEGIFAAAGPGIRAGVNLDELSIVQVAPLVLYSLGLPVPSDITGRVPVEAIEPAQLSLRPPRSVVSSPSMQPIDTATPVGAWDAEAEATVMKRLRALGYVD